MIEWVNDKLGGIENRIGITLFSFLIGLVSLGIAMLVVMPKFELAFHGLQFGLLSNDPFDFGTPNAVRYRILPVLIGYFTFLRGRRFLLIPLFFAILLISSIYRVYRKKGFSLLDSFGMSSLICFSSAIFIQLIGPGYTDAVLYFFVFLSFVYVKKPILSAVFFGLALLTHESGLFMLPALLLYGGYVNGADWRRFIKHAFALVIATVPLLAYRYFVSLKVPVEYDLDFYFSAENIRFTLDRVIPRLPLGLFFVFKLFWVIPLIVIWKAIRNKEYYFVMVILAILLCDLAQMVIAYDVTRMLCLGFPALLISAEKLREYWPDKRFTRIVLVLLLLTLITPQYFMTCDGLVWLPPFFLQ